MKVNWLEEEDTLRKLINDGVSYEKIGKKYNVTGNAIKKAAKNLNINLNKRREINPKEHFNRGKKQTHTCLNCGKEFDNNKNSKNKFCSNKCQTDYQYKEYIKRWKKGIENGICGEYNLSKHIKRYLLEKTNYKCEKCGWSEENPYTHKIPLEVHHMDGNYANNMEGNLQVLCPNCHSLTETYKSHNKKGRKDRRKYYNTK